jgi:hypothetical protein
MVFFQPSQHSNVSEPQGTPTFKNESNFRRRYWRGLLRVDEIPGKQKNYAQCEGANQLLHAMSVTGPNIW